MNEKIKKVLRYISLYGVKRTLVKVVGRSRYSIIALPNFKHERFISFIGCGQFPFSTIAYFLYFGRKANFLGCYDINIDNSKSFNRFWNTLKLYTNSNKLFADKNCKLIYIASNHSTHSTYAIEALKRDIDVYIEKPIAVSLEQFIELKYYQMTSKSQIYVGYNRPFSKAIRLIAKEILNIKKPLTLNCFISGHKIPLENWYRNPEEGTRVCGNLGHWIDLSIHLLNKRGFIPKLYQISISYADKKESDDNINVSISTEFNDIISLFLSSRSEPFEGINESINLQCGDIISKIDDFRSITIWDGSKKKKKYFKPKDVGHKSAILQPFESKYSRDFKEIELSTLLMLKIKDMVVEKKMIDSFNIEESYKNLISKSTNLY